MITLKPWAVYNEIEEYAADWLENLIAAGHIAPGIVDRRSIVDIRPDDYRGFRQAHFFAGIGVWSYALRRAGVSDDTALWTGSCPCQPFSAAGAGGGMDDERHLWPHWFHLIRNRHPQRIYGEQVASKDGLGWLDLVSSDMEGAGYSIWAVDTCSAGSGAPHIRQRLRFCADDLGSADVGIFDAIGERGRCGQPRSQDAGNAWFADQVSKLGDICSSAGQWNTRTLSGTQAREHGSGFAVDGGLAVGPEHASASVGDGQPGPTNSYWRDADWLLCRDARWRPVEPGTFPLVDGSAFRVGSGSPFEGKSRQGMLKGYGNAIDAEATIDFIEATLEPDTIEITVGADTHAGDFEDLLG